MSLGVTAAALAATHAAAIIGGAVVLLTAPALARAAGLRFDRARLGRGVRIGLIAAGLAIPIIAALGIVLAALARLWAQLRGAAAPDHLAHAMLDQLGAGAEPIAAAAVIVLVIVGAPIAEELVYRGFLQSAFREAVRGNGKRNGDRGARGRAGSGAGRGNGRAAVAAVAMTSVFFAAAHAGTVDAHALPLLVVLSVVLGAARERTGSLAAPIVGHAAFNASQLVLAGI
jgi:membrane protease YdiL (CAAX protease family)